MTAALKRPDRPRHRGVAAAIAHDGAHQRERKFRKHHHQIEVTVRIGNLDALARAKFWFGNLDDFYGAAVGAKSSIRDECLLGSFVADRQPIPRRLHLHGEQFIVDYQRLGVVPYCEKWARPVTARRFLLEARRGPVSRRRAGGGICRLFFLRVSKSRRKNDDANQHSSACDDHRRGIVSRQSPAMDEFPRARVTAKACLGALASRRRVARSRRRDAGAPRTHAATNSRGAFGEFLESPAQHPLRRLPRHAGVGDGHAVSQVRRDFSETAGCLRANNSRPSRR